MNDQPITRALYQTRLGMLAEWTTDRANRGDKATYWRTVHTLMSKHAPPTDGTSCTAPDCDQEWPCGTVKGAVRDMQMGAAGW